MIRALYRTQDGAFRTDLRPNEYSFVLEDTDGLLWVDFVDEPPEVCEPILRETFDFHPLAVDDALQETHVPKVDDWSDYLYIVLQAISLGQKDGVEVHTLELDTFLGPNYIVTHHDHPIPAVERVWERCQRAEWRLKGSPARLFYYLADEVVADYMPVVDAIDEAIDRIEDRVFDRPEPETVERIFSLKRVAIELRRLISPQRELLNKLARDDYPVIPPEDRMYFRDVYDHLVRLYDINEGLRDLVSGALDTYLSVINNRMNDVMKTLTIITTLFMPISFLAGFFGMNFFQPVTHRLDVWTNVPTFLLALALMVAAPVGMYLWIRRRRWL